MGLCWSCVDQGSVEVVEQCGKFSRVASPGFNCICPCLGEAIAGTLSMRIQQLDVACETKTLDNVFCNVIVSVQYQVLRESVYDALYKLTDSHSQIRSYVFDVVRSAVPKMDLDDVFTSKEEIANDVRVELTKSMSSFGYQIIQTLVTDIEPASKVKQAMNEINAATRLRHAALHKAEAEKIAIVKAAEAEAEAKYLSGQGIARQRQAIVNGLRESVMQFSSDIKSITNKEVMEMMMVTQYFDTIKDIGTTGSTNAVFLPQSAGGMGDFSGQVRDGFLQAAANQQMSR
ncbi:hypothetical protein BSKO_09983 [Bryopsis sp. KO-2023]|nr:hypothetical protein BSKO_09983 [Bryopsis sp. KO-2023]